MKIKDKKADEEKRMNWNGWRRHRGNGYVVKIIEMHYVPL